MAAEAFFPRRPAGGAEGGWCCWDAVATAVSANLAFLDLRGVGSAASGGDGSVAAAVALRLREDCCERLVDGGEGSVMGGDESSVVVDAFAAALILAEERVTLDVMSNEVRRGLR